MTLGVLSNVFCVGRNYKLHALELGNEVPERPMIFMKPTHAVQPADGRTITLPGASGSVHYETELVLRVGRSYEPGIQVDELIDGLALGIDFTLRDVQSELKKKGQPWLAAKGFLGSAPITPFIAFPGNEALASRDFVLLKNGEQAQRGNAGDMIFNVQAIVEHIANHFGLGAGDVIFTGTPAGVAAIADGDVLQFMWGDERLGECTVRLAE